MEQWQKTQSIYYLQQQHFYSTKRRHRHPPPSHLPWPLTNHYSFKHSHLRQTDNTFQCCQATPLLIPDRHDRQSITAYPEPLSHAVSKRTHLKQYYMAK